MPMDKIKYKRQGVIIKRTIVIVIIIIIIKRKPMIQNQLDK